MTVPPIPAGCAHRPTTRDGLIQPWANVELSDGGCDFRSHHNSRWQRCWTDHLCQVCGEQNRTPMVALCGPRQLEQLVFDEPPLHPECARYVTVACPMVAGERSRYRAGEVLAHRSRGGQCPEPGCDCGGWVPTPGLAAGPGGSPAHEWYAVYLTGYAVACQPDGRVIGGAAEPGDVVRVRLVSEPGRRHTPWLPVQDWLAGYSPPDRLINSEENPT